jgi:hypothetical protein
MRMRVCRLLGVLLAWVMFPTTSALATVVVPVPPEEMAEDADAVITGHVTRIESHWDAGQAQVFTTIAIAVDDVLKGTVDDPEIEVVQPGGMVGGLGSWLYGSPQFEVGERVLVFLTEQPDGSVRVTHLYLGKYSIVGDIETGEELAVRDPNPAGVLVLPGPDGPVLSPDADAEVVPEMKRKIRQRARLGKPGRRLRANALRGALVPVVSQATAGFRLFPTPTRWWEPDLGQNVVYRIHGAGEPLAPTGGVDQIRDALAAWSSVPGSALRLVDGGSTTAQGIAVDGINTISFRDPLNQIGTSGGKCKGVLALGAHFFAQFTTKVVNGTTFRRISEGDLVTNKGWEGCGFYENYANFAETIAHELGHTIGFDHAADPQAIMYGFLHFDGRGPALTGTDRAGVVFVYPGTTVPGAVTLSIVRGGGGAGSVQSAPAGISCGTDCSEAYSSGTVVDLTALPANGSTFTGWSGACSGPGSCRVTLTASTTVTATFATSGGTPGPGPTPGGPDLVVTSLSAPPATATPGARLTMTDTIRNAGDAAARNSATGYYLVQVGSAIASPRALRVTGGTRLTPALNPGQEISTTRSLVVPRATPPGSYTIVVCTDSASRVAEGNESNNCRDAAGTVVIGP